MKQQIVKFKKFSKVIGKGLHIEFKETLEIPSHIKNKELKKAGKQVGDIIKMVGLSAVWIAPGGAVITAMILKYYHKARPSAFIQDKEE